MCEKKIGMWITLPTYIELASMHLHWTCVHVLNLEHDPTKWKQPPLDQSSRVYGFICLYIILTKSQNKWELFFNGKPMPLGFPKGY